MGQGEKVNSYEIAYDMVLDLQQEMLSGLKTQRGELNSRQVTALSATFILQDYLAERIGVAGQTPEGEDVEGITWERIKEILRAEE